MRFRGLILTFVFLTVSLSISYVHAKTVLLQNSPCPASQLEVGGFARLTSSEGLPGFIGFPYVSSGEDALQPATRLIPFEYLENRDLFISEGPYCLDGDNLWRTRILETTAIAYTDVWLFESRNGRRLLQDSDVEPLMVSAYTPDRVNLRDLPPELALDPLMQVAPSGFGGGGLDYDSLVFPGSTRDSITQIFEPALRVIVSITQPDGSIFSTENMKANEFGYVEVALPTALGLPVGTWRVTFENVDETRVVAYQFKAIVPAIWTTCLDSRPVLQFSGFEPNQRFGLVQVAAIGSFKYTETQRWMLQADSNGTLIVDEYLPFAADSSVTFTTSETQQASGDPTTVDLVVETTDRSWQDNLLSVGGRPFTRAILTTYSQRSPDCGTTEQPAEPTRIVNAPILDADTRAYCSVDEVGLTSARFVWATNKESTILLGDPTSDAAVIKNVPATTEILVTDRTHCDAGLLYRSVWIDGEAGWLLVASDGNIVIDRANIQAEPGIYLLQTGPMSTGIPGQYGIEPGQSFTLSLTTTSSENNQFAGVLGYTYGDIWGFQGNPNQSFTIRVESDDFDPIVFVFSANGDNLAVDDDSAGNLGSLIEGLLVPDSAIYLLLVTSVDGTAGEYTIEFTSSQNTQLGQSSQNTAVDCPGSLPIRLAVGGQARVTPGNANRVRNSPESGDVIGRIPGGESFQVLEGPVCGPNNGLAWWRVDYDGLVGWTAESDNSTYWLEPLN